VASSACQDCEVSRQSTVRGSRTRSLRTRSAQSVGGEACESATTPSATRARKFVSWLVRAADAIARVRDDASAARDPGEAAPGGKVVRVESHPSRVRGGAATGRVQEGDRARVEEGREPALLVRQPRGDVEREACARQRLAYLAPMRQNSATSSLCCIPPPRCVAEAYCAKSGSTSQTGEASTPSRSAVALA